MLNLLNYLLKPPGKIQKTKFENKAFVETDNDDNAKNNSVKSVYMAPIHYNLVQVNLVELDLK
jgi:hypothetical protein